MISAIAMLLAFFCSRRRQPALQPSQDRNGWTEKEPTACRCDPGRLSCRQLHIFPFKIRTLGRVSRQVLANQQIVSEAFRRVSLIHPGRGEGDELWVDGSLVRQE